MFEYPISKEEYEAFYQSINEQRIGSTGEDRAWAEMLLRALEDNGLVIRYQIQAPAYIHPTWGDVLDRGSLLREYLAFLHEQIEILEEGAD